MKIKKLKKQGKNIQIGRGFKNLMSLIGDGWSVKKWKCMSYTAWEPKTHSSNPCHVSPKTSSIDHIITTIQCSTCQPSSNWFSTRTNIYKGNDARNYCLFKRPLASTSTSFGMWNGQLGISKHRRWSERSMLARRSFNTG